MVQVRPVEWSETPLGRFAKSNELAMHPKYYFEISFVTGKTRRQNRKMARKVIYQYTVFIAKIPWKQVNSQFSLDLN
jgi:hypothetical protein